MMGDTDVPVRLSRSGHLAVGGSQGFGTGAFFLVCRLPQNDSTENDTTEGDRRARWQKHPKKS